MAKQIPRAAELDGASLDAINWVRKYSDTSLVTAKAYTDTVSLADRAYTNSFFPLDRGANLATTLLPRITVANTAARTALASVVAGQEVYQQDTGFVWVYNGTTWSLVSGRNSTDTFSISSGVVVGTGGSVAKNLGWTFQGGVGGGILTFTVEIILGSAGFSVSAQPIIPYPTGFTSFSMFDNTIELGQGRVQDISVPANARAQVKNASSSAFVITPDVGAAAFSATVPWTWAAGDAFRGQGVVRGTFIG